MNECVDGDYQTFKANDGAYGGEHFFGRYPETAALVADWTDEEIWALKRAVTMRAKSYAAYKAASEHEGQPPSSSRRRSKATAWAPRAKRRTSHTAEAHRSQAMRAFRDRFAIPISDADLPKIPFFSPAGG